MDEKTKSPPEEVISFAGSFLDYAVQSGWITMLLMVDREGQYHPIVASNFDASAEEKKEILQTWIDAITKADDSGLFLKKEIQVQ